MKALIGDYGVLIVDSFSFGFKGFKVRFSDPSGNIREIVDIDGYWEKSTYDSHRNELSYYNCDGYWNKRTYDSNGKLLSYSDGNCRV